VGKDSIEEGEPKKRTEKKTKKAGTSNEQESGKARRAKEMREKLAVSRRVRLRKAPLASYLTLGGGGGAGQ